MYNTDALAETTINMWYNRTMAYRVKYNGLEFLNTPTLKEGWSLVLKEFSFFEVATNSNTEKYAIRHGEYVSPTQMRNRRVRLLFDILANTEEERRDLLKKVQRAFTPESNPSPFNERLRKEISFLDVNCDERVAKCQVLQGVQLSDFANEKRVGISVELITDSPYFRSRQQFALETSNTLSWIQLPTKYPFSWQYYEKRIDIEYEGIVESPLYIELSILDASNDNFPFDKIKILQLSDLWLKILYINDISELWLTTGDKIIVDSWSRRCYLLHENTRTDITGVIEVGSERPSLYVGDNIISIDTGVWDECIDATIKRENLF